MPLPNTATIQDVIEKLEELQGMNQKAELASVIGSPAVSSDTVAEQILILQDIKDTLALNLTNKGVSTVNSEPLEDMAVKVSQIPTMVSGTVNSSGSQLTFDYYGSGFSNAFFVEVSGLSFEPSHIVIVPTGASDSSISSEYYKNLSGKQNYVKLSVNAANQNSLITIGYKSNTNNAYVNATGFKLPVYTSSSQYTYYAYK